MNARREAKVAGKKQPTGEVRDVLRTAQTEQRSMPGSGCFMGQVGCCLLRNKYFAYCSLKNQSEGNWMTSYGILSSGGLLQT